MRVVSEARGPDMHVMLDLETMDTSNHAAIISIGAVAFDREKMLDEFYVTVSLHDSVFCGLTMGADTVLWWLKQSKKAIESFDDGRNMGLDDALYSFSDFCSSHAPRDEIFMWGNGSDFDNVILNNAYRLRDIQAPWVWRNNRCFRTVKSLDPSAVIRKGIHHNALDDAKTQAEHLIYCAKRLGAYL